MHHTRLKAAREAAGFISARSAARALGVPISTYGQHESGNRHYDLAEADHYTAFFAGVRLVRERIAHHALIPEREVLARLIYDAAHLPSPPYHAAPPDVVEVYRKAADAVFQLLRPTTPGDPPKPVQDP